MKLNVATCAYGITFTQRDDDAKFIVGSIEPFGVLVEGEVDFCLIGDGDAACVGGCTQCSHVWCKDFNLAVKTSRRTGCLIVKTPVAVSTSTTCKSAAPCIAAIAIPTV